MKMRKKTGALNPRQENGELSPAFPALGDPSGRQRFRSRPAAPGAPPRAVLGGLLWGLGLPRVVPKDFPRGGGGGQEMAGPRLWNFFARGSFSGPSFIKSARAFGRRELALFPTLG